MNILHTACGVFHIYYIINNKEGHMQHIRNNQYANIKCN
jgi:hypothetical protein